MIQEIPILRQSKRILSDVVLDSQEVSFVANDVLVVVPLPDLLTCRAAQLINSFSRGTLEPSDDGTECTRGRAKRRSLSGRIAIRPDEIILRFHDAVSLLADDNDPMHMIRHNDELVERCSGTNERVRSHSSLTISPKTLSCTKSP